MPERAMTDDVAETIRMLATEFEWPCPADALAKLVYIGLNELTKASIRHADPKLALGTTSLRHVLDVLRHASWEDLEDVQKAVAVGMDIWLDPAPSESAPSSDPQPATNVPLGPH